MLRKSGSLLIQIILQNCYNFILNISDANCVNMDIPAFLVVAKHHAYDALSSRTRL